MTFSCWLLIGNVGGNTYICIYVYLYIYMYRAYGFTQGLCKFFSPVLALLQVRAIHSYRKAIKRRRPSRVACAIRNHIIHMLVYLNYCAQNGGNLHRAPYYNGNPNIGPRIIGKFRPIPIYKLLHPTYTLNPAYA